MNGQLIRDCNKVKRITKKENNRKKSNSNNKTRIKNSTIDNTSLNEKASSANPFVWKKDINVWLTEEGQLYLQSWANDGLSDEQICQKMGIAVSTLWRWCNQEENIRKAITRGRDTMTMSVENILYKCAMGYEYEEDALTKDGDVVRIKKYQPPSTEAQKFILTNRRKDKWKSKNEVALEAQIAAQANVEISKSDSLADDLFGDDEDNETI